MRLLSPGKYGRVARCLLRNRTSGEPIYPYYASFKLTSRCHFNCPFCNIKDEKHEDLGTEKVKRILENLSDSSVVLVSFEGGEPLLRQDIGELLSFARTQDFYLLFTTSERRLERYPMKEYCRFIDFLHISIDEGHGNLLMFDRLEEYRSYGSNLSVQIVVSRDTLHALKDKIRRCHEAGASAVVMPAVHMNRTGNVFPDWDAFEREVRRLKKAWPGTIFTPDGYFSAVRKGKCSTESVIIDTNGELYYPCHILETKGPDLALTPLMSYLTSPEASEARKVMAACKRGCGWFQYFAIPEFTSIRTVLSALKPAFSSRA
jgi:MoaA/NifB/PqqE/SkfB family radical SAM enzyme